MLVVTVLAILRLMYIRLEELLLRRLMLTHLRRQFVVIYWNLFSAAFQLITFQMALKYCKEH